MSLYGNRTEHYRVELLSRTEALLGDLDGVVSGSLSWNANADLPGGGNITISDIQQDIDISSDRIRIWYQLDDEPEYPLGVYVMAAPSTSYSGEATTRPITLIDKLTIVKDDCITETLQIPAGSNLVAQAEAQVRATGETRLNVTPSVAVSTNPMTWTPGTSRLTIVNDLLTAAGYWALYTDRYGQFCIVPYVKPGDRPIAFEFMEGDTAIHSPDWEYTTSIWDACNQVVLVSQADDNGNTMVATAIDDNPDSPTSITRMGRVLNPIVEENVEASSLADLQEQATRKLMDNSNVSGTISVEHAMVPLWFHDSVRFVSQGVELNATVTQMSINLEPGSLVSAEWRQI